MTDGVQEGRCGIVVSCGGCGQSQSIALRGVPYEQARVTCGFLDGTSELYLHPPAGGDMVGKCAACGARALKATVFGYPEAS